MSEQAYISAYTSRIPLLRPSSPRHPRRTHSVIPPLPRLLYLQPPPLLTHHFTQPRTYPHTMAPLPLRPNQGLFTGLRSVPLPRLQNNVIPMAEQPNADHPIVEISPAWSRTSVWPTVDSLVGLDPRLSRGDIMLRLPPRFHPIAVRHVALIHSYIDNWENVPRAFPVVSPCRRIRTAPLRFLLTTVARNPLNMLTPSSCGLRISESIGHHSKFL